MRTSPDCLPCFAKQAAYTAALATDSLKLQKEIVACGARLIDTFDLTLSPPENAVFLYRMIAEQAGNSDIFANLKRISNQTVLNMLPELEHKISQATEPLRTAAILTLAGNIIDYGAHHDFDVHHAVDQCLNTPLAIDDLQKDLRRAKKILYLGDNCGELVFDSLLIKQLDQQITFAVREKPIINDALIADAVECGLDGLCRIISNGTDCPGTPLQHCSDEFKEIFSEADLIISKGQGNFETLSEISGSIYFMLMIKCEIVARHVAEITNRPPGSIKTGDLVLMKRYS